MRTKGIGPRNLGISPNGVGKMMDSPAKQSLAKEESMKRNALKAKKLPRGGKDTTSLLLIKGETLANGKIIKSSTSRKSSKLKGCSSNCKNCGITKRQSRKHASERLKRCKKKGDNHNGYPL
jgi:hypothetical protein